MTWSKAVVFSPGTPISSNTYYKLASHDLVTIGINVTKNEIQILSRFVIKYLLIYLFNQSVILVL